MINISNVRSSSDKACPNLRAYHVTSPDVITSLRGEKLEAKDATSETSPNEEDPDSGTSTKDSSLSSSSSKHVPIINFNDLMGRIFLLNKEGAQRLRARVVKALDDFEGNLIRDSSRLKFVSSMSNDTIEEIFTYN